MAVASTASTCLALALVRPLAHRVVGRSIPLSQHGNSIYAQSAQYVLSILAIMELSPQQPQLMVGMLF